MAGTVKSDIGAPSLTKKMGGKSSDPSIVETYSDLNPQGRVKFWLSQLDQRKKEEKNWRKDGETTIRVYRRGDGASDDADSSDSNISKYNILAANVDVLMPATYSATPRPDVRRRFAEADDVGRTAAEILERALEYEHDQFDVDHQMEASVMDMLLPGRGGARIMYEATTREVTPGDKLQKLGPDLFLHPNGRRLAKMPDGNGWGFAPDGAVVNGVEPAWEPAEGEPEPYNRNTVSRGAGIADGETPPPIKDEGDAEVSSDPTGSAGEAEEWYFGGTPYPHVEDERTWFEHFHWTDFLHGGGRTWEEVPWAAFRHTLTRAQLRKLPIARKVADAVKLDFDTRTEGDGKKEAPTDGRSEQEDMPFKRAVVWEIWYKDDCRVIWVAPSYKDAPLFERDPDVKFEHFYPTPRPLIAIENPDDLIPAPEYFVYKGLAEELNRAVRRLQKLVSACKARGIYAGSVVDFERVFSSDDNELIPSTSAMPMIQGGAASMSDLVWMVPVDKYIAVIQQLYAYVVNLKDTIYEITGISDIARGSTNANETLGAQKLKAQFASIRILRRQRNVQRFVRDLVRMEGDVICQLFGAETLEGITGMRLPTPEEKAIGKAAAAAMAAKQPPPNSLASIEPPDGVPLEIFLKRPTWDEVMKVLRSSLSRSHKVDIETDSTIANDIAQQQGAISELIGAIVQFFNGVAPFVATPGNPQGILPPEAAKTILMSAVRRFRMGKEVEEALDMIGTVGGAPGAGGQAGGQQQAPAEATPPPPDPVEMAKLQQQGQKDQAQLALDARKVQIDEGHLELDRQKFQVEQAERSRVAQPLEQIHAGIMDQVGGIAASTNQALASIAATVDQTAQMVQSLAAEVSQIAAEIDAPAEILRDGGGQMIGVKKGNRVRAVTRDAKGKPRGLQ